MARRRSSLEELELTSEEAARLSEAFRDERFRSLFAEYAAELADPQQRAVYEAEVVALERQRGVEARFLHPEPGWVLRTSQAGSRRCYVNICSHPLVGRPRARPEPGGGTTWSLPHCLAPGREELRRRRRRPDEPRRLLYDVLFHPDTLRLAARSARFRRLVDDTALEALETHFQAGLDRANAVPLRGTKYKGAPQATLLRKPLPGGAPPPQEEEEGGDGEGASPLPPFPTPYAYPPPQPEEARPPAPAPAASTTPRWTLRQRSYVDLQDYRCSRDSAPSPVPRELVVSVELPLLSSAAQAQLEIRGQELQLDSQRPAYSLRLPLPYPVDEARGRATFNKATRQLVVTLPVVPQQSRAAHAAAAVDPPGDPAEQTPPPGPTELPACSEEAVSPASSLAAAADRDGEWLPRERTVTSPPPPGAPVRRSSGDSPGGLTPSCTQPAVPGAAGCRVSPPPTCHDAPDLEAPTGPGNRVDLAVPREDSGLAPSASVGDSAELLQPTTCRSASPVARAPLSASEEDLAKSRSIGSSVPPESCPSVASIPAAPTPLCLGDVDGPVTTLTRHNSSSTDQITEFAASSHFPLCPGRGSSCSNLGLPVSPSNTCSHVGLYVPGGVCPRNRTSDPLLLSEKGLSSDRGDPIISPSCPYSLMPATSPTTLLCPPFCCTQDEESLRLLLQVPGIVPQSLQGEVGSHHYRVAFSSKDSTSYALFLQFPPENKLMPPETEISVSLNNAVIGLAKSPETTRLWTKLYFGLNDEDLKERLFLIEDNIDGFLGSLATASCSSQSVVELRPLVEVLDVSEDKTQIRLKGEEQHSFEPGETEEIVIPRKTDSGQESGSELPTKADNSPLQTKEASGSLRTGETMGRAGWESGHCSEFNPSGPSMSIPGKSLISKLSHEPELACTTSKEATSTTQAQLNWGEPAKTGEGEEGHSQLTGNQGGSESGPAPPVLKETDMRDGSVQLICQHTTHCTVTFQNSLLYELD